MFLWNLSAFLFRSAWIENFPGLYNFPDTHSILEVTHSKLCVARGHVICIACNPLISLGNRCTSSCFSTSSIQLFSHPSHVIYAAFPLGQLRPVYFSKQVYFLLCQTNKRGLPIHIQKYYFVLHLSFFLSFFHLFSFYSVLFWPGTVARN